MLRGRPLKIHSAVRTSCAIGLWVEVHKTSRLVANEDRLRKGSRPIAEPDLRGGIKALGSKGEKFEPKTGGHRDFVNSRRWSAKRA